MLFGPCVLLVVASWLGSCVTPAYVAYVAFPATVLAARFIGQMPTGCTEGAAKGVGAYVYWAILASVVLTSAPSLVSHYLDGGRRDYRSVSRWITENTKKGLLLVTGSPGMVAYHAPEVIVGSDSWKLDDVTEKMRAGKIIVMHESWLTRQNAENLRSSGVPYWIIVDYERDGTVSVPESIQPFVEQGRLVYRSGMFRWDHRQNLVGVYQCH